MTGAPYPQSLPRLDLQVPENSLSTNTLQSAGSKKVETLLSIEKTPAQSFLEKNGKQIRPIGDLIAQYMDDEFMNKNLTDNTLPKNLFGVRMICIFRFYEIKPKNEGTNANIVADYEFIPSTNSEPYDFTIIGERGDVNTENLSNEKLHPMIGTYIGSRFIEKLYSLPSTLRKEIPGYTFLICLHVSPTFQDEGEDEVYEFEGTIKIATRFPLDEEDRKIAQDMKTIKTFSEFVERYDSNMLK